MDGVLETEGGSFGPSTNLGGGRAAPPRAGTRRPQPSEQRTTQRPARRGARARGSAGARRGTHPSRSRHAGGRRDSPSRTLGLAGARHRQHPPRTARGGAAAHATAPPGPRAGGAPGLRVELGKVLAGLDATYPPYIT